ncbi:hypothetical protein LTR09_001082 [Extremus antarcticus]|uniref:Uncharacterized protein n=1 Tax=Extremus antarcticus TaxID=702011 RepID=A0AAJ0GI83_9PEZI|nr:hypothetical protein LTR09_001082 [Extremus antarcticus]
MESPDYASSLKLPRVAITYCTQCKWMLRAGYFGQELLSTFGTTIGEIALIPATGGIFTVYLTYKSQEIDASPKHVLIWDRKSEGGFPETKILKQRVRNHIEPKKNLGHSDTPASKAKANAKDDDLARTKPEANEVNEQQSAPTQNASTSGTDNATECEDCG